MSTVTLLEITDEATRRQFLSMLVAAGLLTACADDEDADPEATPSAPSTRTVDSSHGPIEIPIAPTRVIAMHDQLVGYAIASLGFQNLTGVAVRDAGDPAQALRQFGAVPPVFERLTNIGTYETPDLEAIAAARPDLILGLPYEADPVYDKLKAIAPTVIIDLVAGARPPFQRQRDLARVVGVEPAMDARLGEYRAKLAALKEGAAAGLVGAGFTYLESFGTGPEDNYVIRSDYAPGLMVLQDLGLVPSTTTRSITEEYFMISQERLGDYDADVIFIGLPEETEFDPLNIELMKETFAAEHDQIFFVSRDIWGVELVEALFGVISGLEAELTGKDFELSGEFGVAPSPEPTEES